MFDIGHVEAQEHGHNDDGRQLPAGAGISRTHEIDESGGKNKDCNVENA